VSEVLASARREAEQARHGYVGVEHLLLTLAAPASPVTHRILADQDITLDRGRDAVRLVVAAGRGDGPRHDAATLLGTLGIDLDEIRRQVERRFGPDAVSRLYRSEVGWNLRPRGPLCEPPLTPILKKTISDAVGGCWDNAPAHLPERLLVAALDAASPGLRAVLAELGTTPALLHAAIAGDHRLAG
jgi:hypothetical protein